ncbi:MAG: hypothetical protein A3K19_14635 [Lentisphaerae bacterium RIFOXYB12_FULL_65_16]|nr:MAG: hypothetical protein A3K18_28700 [Lentisphaerae bacterium RIFOXYA12_64_32]OGV87459.1 MAG: hypothetical protein A3K19_14635 [Lentisphaerae bacterium RIFOXYB12_FULL_65_16]
MATEYSCRWTRYRLVTATGEARRLLKVAGPASGVKAFRLLATDHQLLGEETVPHNAGDTWHFGFWVPETCTGQSRFLLEVVAAADTGCASVELAPAAPGEADAMPLRLDQLGAALQQHLATREKLPDAADLAGFVPDMAKYLRQHRIIYQRPADHWGEGLPLGNGTVGATVTGVRGQSQTFFLDRCDLWAASPQGRPYGRVFAGRLDIAFEGGQPGAARKPQPFLQELLLHEAEVVTHDGALTSVARVSAVRDMLEVTLQWKGRGAVRIRATLSKNAIPLSDEPDQTILQVANGSWEAVFAQSYIDDAKHRVAAGPHSEPCVAVRSGAMAVLSHRLPNLEYAMAASVQGARFTWRDASAPRLAAATAEFVLAPGGSVIIRVAITSDRAVPDPAVAAGEWVTAVPETEGHEAATRGRGGAQPSPTRDEDLLPGFVVERPAAPTPPPDAHGEWWARYWRRAFVELPDKLMENLWYFGAYHQASFSRSPTAPGFFGLWHPLDHRTWQECHVADAQTALLYWAPFAINQLELLLSSHHSFAELLPCFLRYNPWEGALVPHMFAPEWAGGKATFGKKNPHKGSIAWLGLNFWWDYLYTRDHAFLAAVAYPLIAAVADYHLGDLVRGDDGRLHSLGSGAAEQNNTADDNCYDRALIGAILRAAADAADALGVEPERTARWRQTLADLFPFPADETSLLETLRNPHPYRCHPVVMFGIHPTSCIEPGSPLWQKAQATYDTVTNLFGFHYEDRHATIPGHVGGQEPNGHATSFLMHAAARLRGWPEVQRLFHALGVRTQLKRNGLRSIVDPRHDRWLTNMAISEATSGQTSGMSEVLVQNYSDHVRVLAMAGAPGTFRFAGLRAHGGFVLAGECVDGAVTQVVVHSLCGGTLRLANPWPGKMPKATPAAEIASVRLADDSEGLELTTPPGVTYRLAAGRRGRMKPPAVEKRDGPRCIVVRDWDEFEPPVVYYPEDMPFAQDAAEERVFLGMPEVEPVNLSKLPAWECVTALLARSDWQARLTGARWLARCSTSDEALDLLVKLAETDPTPVVRYTAGVSLVRLGTPTALGAALRIAGAAELPHLRREILKAVGRLSHTPAGATLLAATFGDLRITGNVFGEPGK